MAEAIVLPKANEEGIKIVDILTQGFDDQFDVLDDINENIITSQRILEDVLDSLNKSYSFDLDRARKEDDRLRILQAQQAEAAAEAGREVEPEPSAAPVPARQVQRDAQGSGGLGGSLLIGLAGIAAIASVFDLDEWLRLPALATIIQEKTEVVGKTFTKIDDTLLGLRLNLTDRFPKISDAVEGFIEKFGKVGEFLKPVGEKIGKFLELLGAVLKKLAWPFTAIFAVIDGISGFVESFKKTGSVVEGLKGSLVSIVDGIVNSLIEFVGGAAEYIADLFGFESLAEYFSSVTEDLTEGIRRGTSGIFDVIAGLFTLDGDRLLAGLGDLAGGFIDIIQAPINAGVEFIKSVFSIGDPETPFVLSDFITEKVTEAFEWFASLFDIDFKAIARKILPDPSSPLAALIPDSLYESVGIDPETGETIEQQQQAQEDPRKEQQNDLLRQVIEAREKEAEAAEELAKFEAEAGKQIGTGQFDFFTDKEIMRYEDPEKQAQYEELTKAANIAKAGASKAKRAAAEGYAGITPATRDMDEVDRDFKDFDDKGRKIDALQSEFGVDISQFETNSRSNFIEYGGKRYDMQVIGAYDKLAAQQVEQDLQTVQVNRSQPVPQAEGMTGEEGQPQRELIGPRIGDRGIEPAAAVQAEPSQDYIGREIGDRSQQAVTGEEVKVAGVVVEQNGQPVQLTEDEQKKVGQARALSGALDASFERTGPRIGDRGIEPATAVQAEATQPQQRELIGPRIGDRGIEPATAVQVEATQPQQRELIGPRIGDRSATAAPQQAETPEKPGFFARLFGAGDESDTPEQADTTEEPGFFARLLGASDEPDTPQQLFSTREEAFESIESLRGLSLSEVDRLVQERTRTEAAPSERQQRELIGREIGDRQVPAVQLPAASTQREFNTLESTRNITTTQVPGEAPVLEPREIITTEIPPGEEQGLRETPTTEVPSGRPSQASIFNNILSRTVQNLGSQQILGAQNRVSQETRNIFRDLPITIPGVQDVVNNTITGGTQQIQSLFNQYQAPEDFSLMGKAVNVGSTSVAAAREEKAAAGSASVISAPTDNSTTVNNISNSTTVNSADPRSTEPTLMSTISSGYGTAFG